MHHSHLQIEIKVIKVSETEKDTILIFANDTENMTVESRRGRDVHEGSSMSQKQDAEGTASENNDESGIWLVFKTVFKKKLP